MIPRLLAHLLRLVLIVLAIAVLNFALLKSLPGDLADVVATESGAASSEQVNELRERFGLGRSVPAQLASYVAGVLRGDFGQSFRFGEPVAQLVLGRLPATVALVGLALPISVLLGMLLGMLSARRPNGLVDAALSLLSTLGYSAPMFWTALMLIVAFGVKLPWFPVGGIRNVTAGYTGLRDLLDVLWHLVLPVATLSIYYVAIYARLYRASLIEQLSEDYIRTARAKGAQEGRVLFLHALRNATLPVLTMLGLQSSAVLGGSIVVETVFAWPGLGQLSFEAVRSRDVQLLLGVLLLSGILVVLANLVVDLLQARLDPRIRHRPAGASS
ncbi:ABC transporter permease [Bradyrhizobium sp. HKCCYLR20261]|uniref:ABC transporter permease n=1 Tax=Bradyrhizobium sp. HKCCYLR20261 TaxID=3420760 RepID=UPI003EB95103